MTMPNGFSAADAERLSDAERRLIERRARLLGPAYRLFYERPLHTVRGEGVWLYDNQGNRYLDAYNNVASIGHCHPRVVQAIASQAAVLNTHTRYLQEGILDYAEDLLATFPEGLDQVMFTCTGSEANDLALRIARQYTGGTGVIITRFAYHGVTGTISELSPSLGAGITLPPTPAPCARPMLTDWAQRTSANSSPTMCAPPSPTCAPMASSPPRCCSTASSPATACWPIRPDSLPKP